MSESKVNIRNKKVIDYIEKQLSIVSTRREDDFASLEDYQTISQILIDLIEVSAKGFRGVVATALVGKYLNSEYAPLTNFYDCNPRSIFENGIFIAFSGRIPCGKSDPLNVAKNIQKLDLDWANGKRPQKAAEAVVKFLQLIEEANSKLRLQSLIEFFFFRLNQCGLRTVAHNVIVPSSGRDAQNVLASKLISFVLSTPEGGAIPQIVIALLLQKIFKADGHEIVGWDDSVFSTNTTAKKPADMWLAVNGVPELLYEITVKKVDNKRLDDSLSTLIDLELLDKNIFFVCRIPKDTEELIGLADNVYNYKNKKFNFIDIEQLILSIFCLLTNEDVDSVLSNISNFINDINRPIETKKSWNIYFNE